MADLNGDAGLSHPLAKHAVKSFSPAGSDDVKPLVVDRTLPVLGVSVGAITAPFAASGKMRSKPNFMNGTRSKLLTNHQSGMAISNRKVESTSSTKSGFDGVKCSCSR